MCRRIGVGEVAGDTVAVENGGARRDSGAAHPACQYRLPGNLGGGGGQLSATCVGACYILRCQDNKQAIAVLVGGGNLKRFGIAIGAGITQHIDGVVAPCAGEKSVEFLQCIGGDIGKFAAAQNQRVGGKHARPAGIGDNSEIRPIACGCLLSTSAM